MISKPIQTYRHDQGCNGFNQLTGKEFGPNIC